MASSFIDCTDCSSRCFWSVESVPSSTKCERWVEDSGIHTMVTVMRPWVPSWRMKCRASTRVGALW